MAAMRFPAVAVLALSASLAVPAFAQERLTPERLFSAPDLSGPTARGVAFSPDGRLVTYLRARTDDPTTLDLWAVDAAGGEPRRLVDASALETGEPLSEAETARRERMRISERGVVQYSWDSQGRQILVPVSGDLYLAQVADGAVRRLTQTPGDEVDAKVSPEGGFVSFVRDQNLYVVPTAGGAERALTTEGRDAVSYATADFIAQEELDRDAGYWWSPGDARIAYARVDESTVDLVPRLEIGPDGSAVAQQRYPRAGRPNALVQLFVQSLSGGAPVRVDLGANTDIYLARVDWSQDGRTLYVQRLSRDQKTLDLLAVDPATGASRTLLTERGEPWINLNRDLRPLADGGFLMTSERTGFAHVYLYGADGRLVRQVTDGDWPVRSVAGVDEATRRLFFMASTQDPTQQHLYEVSYAGVGQSRRGSAPERFAVPRRITSGQGSWSATLPKGGALTAFVGSYSDPDTPPSTALYALDGRRLRWIEENRVAEGHPYAPYAATAPRREFGTLTGPGGETLHYVLSTPPGFDPSRRYPAIVYTYGGPHVQVVTRSWNGALLRSRLLSEAGYVVFMLDGRGSYNRGLAFEAALNRRMGQPEVEDQMAGVAWLRARPFVDPARVGVYGWSYGGYMTLLMMTTPGNGLAAGAAGASPVDWRFYDTGYTERYMGTPQENLAGYDAGSTLPRLDNLTGRILLLHGMSDDNVPFDNATRMMAALQQRGVVFDTAVYPGQRHGVRGLPLQLHLWRTYLDFFDRTLGDRAMVAGSSRAQRGRGTSESGGGGE